jgi:hypothetical protein
MNRKLLTAGFLGAALAVATITPVTAQVPGVPGVPSLGLSFGLKASTLGIGVDVAKKVLPRISGRLGFNYAKASLSAAYSGIDYTASFKLTSAILYADLYLLGPIRLSAGVGYNNNNIGLLADPASGTVSVGSQTFQASDIATISGTIGYARKIAPYLGLGIGGRGRIGLTMDFGVLFTGPIDVTYTGTMNPAVPQATKDAFNTQIQNETTQVEADANDKPYLKIWPVLGLGLVITI